jgi:helicase
MSSDVLDKLRQDNNFLYFTETQKAALEAGLCQGESLCISAPTSSGKTTIAEIAAIEAALKGNKTLYLVTHRALAEEKYNLFKLKYNGWFSVSISTGDHTEGDWDTGILVATYEKYLSLLSSENTKYSVEGKIIIADEIQILNDSSRGADIEVLCSVIIERKPVQLIALSATISNIKEIANWLNCKCVNITNRDVKLKEEIWHNSSCFYKYYGDDECLQDETRGYPTSTINAVNYFLSKELYPILVFTMTKPQATNLANTFAETQKQHVDALVLSEKLELFSEPTLLTNQLKNNIERKVAFHSADLSFSERSFIEQSLRENSIKVIFATPTLAAGVNFPVRTVIFDSFNRFWVKDNPWLPKSEYRNMSGRAGRLGYHEEGNSVLIAKNQIEFIQAKKLLSNEYEPLKSVLFDKSIRKIILNLISSKICLNFDALITFFTNTFWYFSVLEKNPIKIEKLNPTVKDSVEWLIENELIINHNSDLTATRLGAAIASSGLLPSTGVFLYQNILENIHRFEQDDYILPLLHLICASDEFSESIGQRFLPYANNNQPERIAWQVVNNCNPFVHANTGDFVDRIINAAYGLYLWQKGTEERELRNNLPKISHGEYQTLASNVKWILEGIAKIMSIPDANIGIDLVAKIMSIPDANIGIDLVAKINMFSESIQFGVPIEILDILKACKSSNVLGFGRHRAMILVSNNLSDMNTLLEQDIDIISNLMSNQQRAESLMEAISSYFPHKLSLWKKRHLQRVSENYKPLLSDSYDKTGDDYEVPVKELLNLFEWKVTKLDDGKRQGVPDFIIEFDGKSILLECKTREKRQVPLDTSDAFAVLTKALGISANHLITLGKPDFNSHSKEKAVADNKITLLAHYCFIEAVVQFLEGKQTTETIFNWLLISGVASIDKLN